MLGAVASCHAATSWVVMELRSGPNSPRRRRAVRPLLVGKAVFIPFRSGEESSSQSVRNFTMDESEAMNVIGNGA